MLGKFRSRLTYANVVATLALFLALGGGTTAMALQGRNTVDSGDIINQQVKSPDLENAGVRSVDVLNGSLAGIDVAPKTLTGGHIDESTLGTVPTAGNADKLDDLDGFQLMQSSTYTKSLSITGAANATRSGTAACDPGDKVLSGGFGGNVGGDPGDVASADTFISRSVPANIGQGWTVVYQSGATADDIKVWALCANH